MAWEEFEQNNFKGITGDRPKDEIALALARIAREYEDRFSRKPTVVELLYALESVLGARPEKYVSDPAGLGFATFNVQRDFERGSNFIDSSQYECVYTDKTSPGYYLVLRRSESKKDEAPVIKIPRLDVDGRVLICEYEILDATKTDKMAEELIEQAVLKEFLQDDFSDQSDHISFRNLKTNYQQQKPYPK